MRRAFNGVLALNSTYTPAEADGMLSRGEADAFSFGRRFLANPDLPHRFRHGAELNAVNLTTIYAPDATGYTDYPALE